MKKIVFLSFSILLLSCSSSPVREVASGDIKNAALTSDQIKSALKEENAEAVKLREKGTTSFIKADYPRAIRQIETAYLLSPQAEDTRPQFHLYYSYLATGEFKKALQTAEKIVQSHPYLSLSYQQLGLAHYFLGEVSDALKDFQKASEFEAHSPRLHFYKGLTELKLKQKEDAENSFRKAEKEYRQILKSNDDDLYANYELASLFLFWNTNLKEVSPLLEKAKTLVKKEREELPQETQTLFIEFYLPLLEGIYAYRQANPQAAIDSLFTAFSNAPSGTKSDLAETLFYLGQSHKLLGSKVEAKALLEQSLNLDPKGPLSEETAKSIADLSNIK